MAAARAASYSPRVTTIHRICPLCEATCGISVTVEDGVVTDLRGDDADAFSRGYICPKAYGLKGLEEDPDRLRRPLLRRDGRLVEVGWDEAFAAAIDGLTRVRAAHGPNAIGTYLGNPTAHSLHAMVYGPVLLRALGTRQRYSASSADQLPKMVSAGLMFGAGLTIPVPDLDRTDYLLVLGGNPRVSNGSLMTAPDVGVRLDAIIARGGKVVVVDPRRSETAARASEHVAIRPGMDAAFLLAIVHVWNAEGALRLGRAEGHVHGVERIPSLVAPFSPEAVAAATGIDAVTTRRIAHAFAAAERAACYGRIGTTCQRFGTLASWAVDLVNILSGNLDREGGAMFTTPAANRGGSRPATALGGRGVRPGKPTRVRGLPTWFGEAPVATLADEITTPGTDQVRAMVTLAGNPVSSAPGVAQLVRAFASLDFMVAVDFYLNETTRHAHVILPPPAPLERDTYDLALYQLAIRNVARYSRAALPRPAEQPDEWEILATLAKGMVGAAAIPLAAADDVVLGELLKEEIGEDGKRWPGLTMDEARAALGAVPGPRRVLDLLLRTGPWGDGFGRAPGGLSLAALEAAPHGVDLGPLVPQLPQVLRTPDARIDLAPALIVADLPRLERELGQPPPELVLIGRRQLRSNNSWMHNLPALMRGPARCTLLMHPSDAASRNLVAGARARVASGAGSFEATVELSDEVMPGVISLPHGWGHGGEGVRQSIASAAPGANVNLASDPGFLDPPSGNAAFNGVPVTVQAV